MLERQKLRSSLEVTTNIAVLLVALAVLIGFGVNVFDRFKEQKFVAGLQKGKSFGQVSNIDYSQSNATLLIALNVSCKYCADSLPFYRKLLNVQSKENSFRIVTMFPNNAEDVSNYLKDNGLVVEAVPNVDFKSLHIPGTPTIVLIDNSGTVRDFWLGELTGSEADQLVLSLTGKQ